MAQQRYQYYPEAPGPQDPSKYGVRTGPNYAKWGEQKGFLYDPYTDTYKKDPRVEEARLRAEGLIQDPPKPPGLLGTIAPIAGVLGAGALATEIGKGVGSGGLFGLGSSTTAPTATTVGANAAATTGATALPTTTAPASTGGLLGLGNTGAATVAPEAVTTAAPIAEGATTGAAADTAIASTADGGVMLANGSTVPGVATSANGGTVLADGSIVGGTEAAPMGGMLPAVGVASLVAYLNNMYEGGVKDIIRGKGKTEDYTNLALDINPVTAPINMGLRLFGQKSVGRMLAGGKSDDQKRRDEFRSIAQRLGVADDNYKVNFSDGTSFDIGKDGGAKLANIGENIDGKTERHYYDVDFSNPLAVSAIPRIQGLVNSLYGDNVPAKAEQRVGLLVNAVTNGAQDHDTVNRRIAELEAKKGGTGQTVAPVAPNTGGLLGNTRSQTKSPGIGLDGKPFYGVQK